MKQYAVISIVKNASIGEEKTTWNILNNKENAEKELLNIKKKFINIYNEEETEFKIEIEKKDFVKIYLIYEDEIVVLQIETIEK